VKLISELIEQYSEPVYTVKRKSNEEFEVAKFTDSKHPDVVYKVHQHAANDFSTDSPAYFRMQQAEKHIKLVKRFLRDGEPGLTAYKFDTANVITRHKFGDDKSSKMMQGSELDSSDSPSGRIMP